MRLLTTMQFSRFSGDLVPRGNSYFYHLVERVVNGWFRKPCDASALPKQSRQGPTN
jgi:hypothetical protein